MALEYRYLNDDTTTYDDEDVAEVIDDFMGQSFVIPYVGNHLNWRSISLLAGTYTIKIDTGAAIHEGFLYENDEEVSLTVSAPAINPKIIRIVLRRDPIAQTIRLTLLEGAEAVNPSLPALGANDMPLYWVMLTVVPNFTIDPIEERDFGHMSPLNSDYVIENIANNPEYMAYSDPVSGNSAPDCWSYSGAGGTYQANASIGSNTPRGQAIYADLTVTGHLSAACSPPPVKYVYHEPIDSVTYFTAKFTIQVITAPVQITFKAYYGFASSTGTTYYFDKIGTYDVTLRIEADISDCRYVMLLFEDGEFVVGPIIIVKGLVPGPFKQKHERIFFENEVTDANWNATAYGVGTTAVSLNAAFNGYILRNTQAIWGRFNCRDSASAANTSRASIWANKSADEFYYRSTIELTGEVNDANRETLLFTVIDQSATYGFTVSRPAVGGDLYITIKLLGIWT